MAPSALPAEAVRGLPRLRLRVEPVVPSLVRGLVAMAAHPGSLSDDTIDLVTALNKRRRAATEWLRAILDGAVDAATLRNVAEVWLPALIGGSREAVRARAATCIEYVRGSMTGLVMARPEDNLVPEARTLFAIDSILAQHLGAVVGSGTRSSTATPSRPSAKVPV
ncbi:MAG: hypothetical protein R3F56_08520 [Planctomycetota bacterium]